MHAPRSFLRLAGLALALLAALRIVGVAHAGVAISSAPGYLITWNGNDGDFFSPNNPAYAPKNVALFTPVTAFGSSEYGVVHFITNVRDGRYGNNNSWLANQTDPNPYIGLDLKGQYPLTGVAWGRDNGNNVADACGGQCTDRWSGVYTLQVTRVANPAAASETGNPATGWANIGTLDYQSNDDTIVGGLFTGYYRHQYQIAYNGQPVQATGVRIKAPTPNAIDEIELYQPQSVPQSGLTTWLKADAGLITDGSGNVQMWVDQSGANHDATQATESLRPGVAANFWLGKPVVRFDGTGRRLALPDTATLGIQNSDYEMFIVARSGLGDVRFLAGGTSTQNYEVHLNGGQGVRFIPNPPWNTQSVDFGANGAFSNNVLHAFAARVDGNTGYVRVDTAESSDTAASARSSANVALMLGIRGDNTYPLNGDIAEVLIYNRALTPQERAQVETYLIDRWFWNSYHRAETGGSMLGTNIAPAGTAFAKDCIGGYPAHAIAHLNDGKYGNEKSWLAASMNSFAGIAFDKPYDITSIAFGRDNGGEATQYMDRYQGTYTLQYTRVPNPNALTPDSDWTTIGMFEYNGGPSDGTGYLRHLYTFDRIWGVTGVRILTTGLSENPNAWIAIDEIEVGAVPEPAALVLCGLGIGLLIAAGRRRCG